MCAKSSRAMMVLAVHIVCDGAANGDEAGARSDGRKPAFGEEYLDQVGEADAALAANDPRGFVEGEDTVETAAFDELAAAVEAGVAITAAVAKGKQRAGFGGPENLRELIAPCRLMHCVVPELRIATP